MKLKSLPLLALISLSACAQAMSGIVDSEMWYRDCKPYRFPRNLPFITPESPNSAVMDPATAPKRAIVRRTECSIYGSWQVVDLVPAKDSGTAPAVAGSGTSKPAKFDLRDVPPPFGPTPAPAPAK